MSFHRSSIVVFGLYSLSFISSPTVTYNSHARCFPRYVWSNLGSGKNLFSNCAFARSSSSLCTAIERYGMTDAQSLCLFVKSLNSVSIPRALPPIFLYKETNSANFSFNSFLLFISFMLIVSIEVLLLLGILLFCVVFLPCRVFSVSENLVDLRMYSTAPNFPLLFF